MKKKKTSVDLSCTHPPFHSLAGQILIAMPGIGDPQFEQTVIYLYAHSQDKGAAGIVINQPAVGTSFHDVLDELHITHHDITNPPPVLIGGPIQVMRGFILHSQDYTAHMTIRIGDRFALTASQDILYDLACGKGPKHALLSLGHATWESGQLEEELADNVWLTATPSNELMFSYPLSQRWSYALKSLGVNPACLLSFFGNRIT